MGKLKGMELTLFKDTEELLKKEKKKGERVNKLDNSLEPLKEDINAMRGSVNLSEKF